MFRQQTLNLYLTIVNYFLDTIFSVDIFFENYEASIIELKKVVISPEILHKGIIRKA